MSVNYSLSHLNTGLKVDNKLNAFSELTTLNELESSIFFFCLLKAQDKQEECSVDELKYYIPESVYKRSATKLCDVANLMLKKLAKINFEVLVSATEEEIVVKNITSLFSSYSLIKNGQTNGLKKIVFSFNPELRCLIDDLRSNYTLLELRDYVTIKGKFAKRLYTLLRQFRTSGIWKVKLQTFRKIMGVSDSYTYGILKNRIIIPAIKELQQVNLGLKRRTIERYNKTGHPLSEYEIAEKEKAGAFHLFYDLRLKEIKQEKSKKIGELWFTFAPQDPKLNHEENLRRYKLKAQQPRNNENGRPIAQTAEEVRLKKELQSAKDKIAQLEAQTNTTTHPNNQQTNDPTSHQPAEKYRAEQPSRLAQGVSLEQSNDLQVHPQYLNAQHEQLAHQTEQIYSFTQEAPAWFTDIPLPEEGDEPYFE